MTMGKPSGRFSHGRLQTEPLASTGMTLLPRHKFLTFHGIGPPSSDATDVERPYWVPVDLLERLLDRLSEVEASHDLEFHVTCDDGFASDYNHVLSALVRRARRGHFFPITGRIDTSGCVSAAELREMHAAGMGIGGHGASHVDLRSLDDRALKRDLTACRDTLEAILGAPVTCISVPFGGFDARVVEIARGIGFTRIFTSAGGFATTDSGLIPRTTIKNTFDPGTDLTRLVSVSSRVRSSVVDRVKRWKNGG